MQPTSLQHALVFLSLRMRRYSKGGLADDYYFSIVQRAMELQRATTSSSDNSNSSTSPALNEEAIKDCNRLRKLLLQDNPFCTPAAVAHQGTITKSSVFAADDKNKRSPVVACSDDVADGEDDDDQWNNLAILIIGHNDNLKAAVDACLCFLEMFGTGSYNHVRYTIVLHASEKVILDLRSKVATVPMLRAFDSPRRLILVADVSSSAIARTLTKISVSSRLWTNVAICLHGEVRSTAADYIDPTILHDVKGTCIAQLMKNAAGRPAGEPVQERVIAPAMLERPEGFVTLELRCDEPGVEAACDDWVLIPQLLSRVSSTVTRSTCDSITVFGDLFTTADSHLSSSSVASIADHLHDFLYSTESIIFDARNAPFKVDRAAIKKAMIRRLVQEYLADG